MDFDFGKKTIQPDPQSNNDFYICESVQSEYEANDQDDHFRRIQNDQLQTTIRHQKWMIGALCLFMLGASLITSGSPSGIQEEKQF